MRIVEITGGDTRKLLKQLKPPTQDFQQILDSLSYPLLPVRKKQRQSLERLRPVQEVMTADELNSLMAKAFIKKFGANFSGRGRLFARTVVETAYGNFSHVRCLLDVLTKAQVSEVKLGDMKWWSY